MLIKILKLLFSLCAAVTAIYSISTFGSGLWSFIFLGIALLVLLSVFIEKLNRVSVLVIRISGVLSVIALIFLLLAATIGGSFNMSESNQIFGYMLGVLSILGLSSFFWNKLNK